ncbi:hypothetical protein R70211_02029 [Paraburkholderia domus]|uniref:Uncharacterized protein n=1 Tax=Paraburkholderia domus TaxID=2793075 RepID=A0A9N8MNR3_9BURK|nr:hypothetical protein R70211_02029 [Paraburkholderia domus]
MIRRLEYVLASRRTEPWPDLHSYLDFAFTCRSQSASRLPS